MDRRTFLRGITLQVLCAPLAAGAQQARTPRIGALNGGVPFPHLDAAFVQGLHELGWHEGKNILIEWRHADGAHDRLPELVDELMRLNVDLFVSFHNPATTAIKRVTATIPIVMRFAIDPIGQGYVKTLAQPGDSSPGSGHEPLPGSCSYCYDLMWRWPLADLKSRRVFVPLFSLFTTRKHRLKTAPRSTFTVNGSPPAGTLRCQPDKR
jgi:ABC transporter substrate binding protein